MNTWNDDLLQCNNCGLEYRCDTQSAGDWSDVECPQCYRVDYRVIGEVEDDGTKIYYDKG